MAILKVQILFKHHVGFDVGKNSLFDFFSLGLKLIPKLKAQFFLSITKMLRYLGTSHQGG